MTAPQYLPNPNIFYVEQTAPAIDPVTLAEAKSFARVETTADDTLIQDLVTAARVQGEQHTRRKFINQTWDVFLDGWPSSAAGRLGWWDGERTGPVFGVASREVRMPLSPLSAITDINTFADDDSPTVFAASNYQVDVAGNRVVLREGATWPTFTRQAAGIRIRTVFGYGAAAADVPDQIRTAIKLHVTSMYEHRGDEQNIIAIPPQALRLYNSVRVPRL